MRKGGRERKRERELLAEPESSGDVSEGEASELANDQNSCNGNHPLLLSRSLCDRSLLTSFYLHS